MTISPILALILGWDAFFPVMLTSVIGAAICLMAKAVTTNMAVGQMTAELVQDLVFADKDRRDPDNSGFPFRDYEPSCR